MSKVTQPLFLTKLLPAATMADFADRKLALHVFASW